MRARELDRAPALTWVAADGRRENLVDRRLRVTRHAVCDGGMVRVLHCRAEPGELPDGAPDRHLVTVNVGPPLRVAWGTGDGWRTGSIPALGVCILPARERAAARWQRPGAAVVVEIAPERLAAAAARLESRPSGVELSPAQGMRDGFLARSALALSAAAHASGAAARLEAESVAAALLAHLLRAHAELRPAHHRTPPLRRAALARVLQHIADHLQGPIPLTDLAAVAGMNLYGFVRAFKESTGVTPHRFLVQARVERAKLLLRDRALTIAEVSHLTGFATPSHFASRFRRAVLATPREYRATVL